MVWAGVKAWMLMESIIHPLRASEKLDSKAYPIDQIGVMASAHNWWSMELGVGVWGRRSLCDLCDKNRL